MKDGGPAFPSLREMGDIATTDGGMSLRDWFAGQAIGAIIRQCAAETMGIEPEKYFAKKAYGVADAMLAIRDKENQP